MATWNSRGLRGSALEDIINHTNERYRECGLALIQKIPTPIKPINIDSEKHQITLAYFEQKSTVDYIGVIQSIPVCFDAKESIVDTVPLHNIHPHQIAFMEEFEKQGGLAFILLGFTKRDEYYYVPFADIKRFWDRKETGGRKSFTYDEVDKTYRIRSHRDILLHYLEQINLDIQSRE